MGWLSKEDRLTLKVAYMLVNIDGAMTSLEKEAFSKATSSFQNFSAGDSYANNVLLEAKQSIEGILPLMDLYSEDEYVKCFVNKIGDEISCLLGNAKLTRKAFYVWIGLALSDREVTSLERKALAELQEILTSGNCESSEQDITDDMLAEIEDTCQTMILISEQIDQLPPECDERKSALKNSFDALVKSAHDFIELG